MNKIEHPMNAEELSGELKPHASRELILARAQYSPSPNVARRILVFLREGSRLRPCLDSWVETRVLESEDWAGDITILRAGCDAMYATAATILWYEHERRFYVYARNENKELFRTHRFDRDARRYDGVHCYIADDWVKRGVLLQRKGGRDRIVAEVSEFAATIDPTYDAMDVMGDGSWCGSLGRDLASFLGIPLRVDDVLR